MAQSYFSKFAKELLDVLHKKGWNVYRSLDLMNAEDIIRQNLAQSLEVGGKYVLLPVADNPKDPKQVFDALENLAQKLDRKMPTITVGCDSYSLTGFTLKESDVKIHTPEGTTVSYPIFIRALDSLIQTK